LSDATFFVHSQILKDVHLVEMDGQPLVEQYSRISSEIEKRCGRGSAAIFAEPRLTRGNGVSASRIDWYSDLEGSIRTIDELDPGSQAAVRARTLASLSKIRPLVFDPEIGHLVAAALNVADEGGVLSVGGEPVIVSWGTLPSAAFDDVGSRERLFAQSLQPFVEGLPLPPISLGEWQRSFRVSPQPRADGLESSSTAHPSSNGGVAKTAQVAASNFLPGLAENLRPPVIACILAGIFLLLLFIPGVFPGSSSSGSVSSSAITRRALEQLQLHAKELQSALDLECVALREQVNKLIPHHASEIMVPVPAIASSAARDNPANPSVARGPITPPPVIAPIPPGPIDLAARAERGVALVVAGDVSGTGFFVTQDTLVTNRHVVKDANGDIKIVSKSVGVIPANLLRISEGGDFDDFAVLRVSPQSQVIPFELTITNRQLQQVMASGFPGIIMNVDPVFQRALQGDATAVGHVTPSTSPGAILDVQQIETPPISLLSHSATIAPGNSGGPLLDYCGRVLGVNTFGITDPNVPVTFSFALGADGLARFLARAGVNIRAEAVACEPQMIAMPSPQAGVASVPSPPARGGAAGPPVPAASPGTPEQKRTH
jgi:S1-C subfamily serine protease